MYGELTKERYGELREQDGIDIGYARGMARGMERGREQGLSQGLSQGAAQEKLKNAKAMKDAGIKQAVISNITGLSANEIKAL